MKLITTENQKNLIEHVLDLAESVALGEVEHIFFEYAASYYCRVDENLLSEVSGHLNVYPEIVAEIRELRINIANNTDIEFNKLIKLGRILEGYSRIGQAQFNYALDEFTKPHSSEDLIHLPEYQELRKKLTGLDSKISLSLNNKIPYNFLLAYEISKKITRDISWIQYPLGGISSNFELPHKITKEPLVEIK